ncbi:MAG TPA: hypothetical protein GX506_08090 [Firmicutes bacterium]|nr:hypothetical protein [Bacillota bacterium]
MMARVWGPAVVGPVGMAAPGGTALLCDYALRSNEMTGHADNSNGVKKLREVCQDFESIFLQYLIREMRASVPKSGLFGGGFSEEVFLSLFDENLAKEMARRGGIGIGEMLQRQLSRSAGPRSSVCATGPAVTRPGE